jgi:hypothetical protein
LKDGQVTINGRPVFNKDSEPLVNDGLKVGDLWVDTSNPSDLIINICTSVSPRTFDIIATSGSPAAITGATNVNTVGVGVFEGQSGNSLNFRGIVPTNSKLTATYNGTTKTVDLEIIEDQIDHNNLLNYVSNQHVDHSTVSISGSAGVSGGGDLTTNRTLSLDIHSLTNETSPVGGDEVVIFDSGSSTNKKATFSNINLSILAGGFDSISPLTTKGDLIGRTTVANIRVPVGSDGQSIVADSAQTVGWKWSAVGTITNAANINVGGVGVFNSISTDTLQFKGVAAASTKVTVTDNTTNKTIDVDVVESNINHNNLLNFVANKHIDHSTVSITAGSGLSGGGDLTTTRSLAIDILSLTAKTTPVAADTLLINDSVGSVNKKITLSSIQLSDLTGPLSTAKGGTGSASVTTGFNNLSPLTTKGDLIVHNGTNNVRQAAGANGTFLKYDSAQTTGVTAATAVTSVALSDSSINDVFTVSGSPITTSGTFGLSKVSQAANKAYMSPVSAAGNPSFRTIKNTDLDSYMGDGFSLFDDFLSGTTAGNTGWTNTSGAGGTVTLRNLSTGVNVGVVSLNATTSSGSFVYQNQGAVGLVANNTGDMIYDACVSIAQVFASDTWIFRFGMMDLASPNNGIYIDYQAGAVNQWRAVCIKAGVATTSNLFAAVVGTFYKFRIYYDSTNSQVIFFNYSGSTLVTLATITTNIPNTAGFSLGQVLQKLTGTANSVRADIDYVGFTKFTPGR